MPRRDIVFAKGNYYHAFNRGVNRAPIFFRPGNYYYCMNLMMRNQKKHNVQVISYCLMPNHYHFLLRQDGDTPVSEFVKGVFNPYVQAVNREQKRRGTLFESRFKATWVDSESYLLHLCRYIHANPLTAGLVHKLDHWPFSNLAEWSGEEKSPLWDPAFVSSHFPQPDDYLNYIRLYLQEKGIVPDNWNQYLAGLV